MPKSEYIDRESAIEAAIDAADEWGGGYNPNRAAQIREGINYLPAADVKPVVRGEWVWDENGMDWGIGAWICARCHNRPETTWHTMRDIIPLRWSGSHYCPNCGADMTGGGHAEV